VTQTKIKRLKQGTKQLKKRKQIALDTISILRWFQWLFLLLVPCFNNILEIFPFSLMYTACVLPVNYETEKCITFHLFCLPLLVSAKHDPFFLLVATVSMSEWDVQMW